METREVPQGANRAWSVLAFTLPPLLALQPWTPHALQATLVYGRTVVAPLLVVSAIPHLVNWPAIALLTAIVVVGAHDGASFHTNDFFLTTTAIYGSIVGFSFGRYLRERHTSSGIWRGLVWGVSLTNGLTLTAYAAVLLKVIDVRAFNEVLGREGWVGLWRFSFGNAIELPFVMTALLFAGIVGSNERVSHLAAAYLNLATAVVSESRLVVVIAALLALGQIARASAPSKTLSCVAVGLVVVAVWNFLVPIGTSLSARFTGQDYGSFSDRLALCRLVIDHLTIKTLIIGDGVTSSAILVERALGQYRSVESVGLQLLKEIGLGGMLLCALAASGSRIVWRRLRMPSLLTLLIWAQLLLFLPVFNLMPLVSFALGVDQAGRRLGGRRREGGVGLRERRPRGNT